MNVSHLLDNPAHSTQLNLQIQNIFTFHSCGFHVTSRHDAIGIVQMLNRPLFHSVLIKVTEGSKSLIYIPELEGLQKRTVTKIDVEVSQKEDTERSGIAFEMKQRTHEANNSGSGSSSATNTTTNDDVK